MKRLYPVNKLIIKFYYNQQIKYRCLETHGYPRNSSKGIPVYRCFLAGDKSAGSNVFEISVEASEFVSIKGMLCLSILSHGSVEMTKDLNSSQVRVKSGFPSSHKLRRPVSEQTPVIRESSIGVGGTSAFFKMRSYAPTPILLYI